MVITWLQMLQWKCALRLSLQKGRPQDSSSGSGPNCGWELRDKICGITWALLGEVEVLVDPLVTISWLACKSLASGFSASLLVFENDTIKFTPSLDFKEIVGLTSSPKVQLMYEMLLWTINLGGNFETFCWILVQNLLGHLVYNFITDWLYTRCPSKFWTRI